MKNKEILFISNFLGAGGAARVVSVLAEELANRGYEVTIYSYPFENKEEYYCSDRVNHIKFDMKHQKGILYKFERITKLRKAIKKHKDATVISFEYFMNMQTIVAMFGLRNRLIVSERNDPVIVGGKAPTKQLRNFLYNFTDCLVCQTQDALEYFPKAIKKKAIVIMNPIKDNLPEPWKGERKKIIVNFCRLEKQKNIPLLIDSFEEFYKTHPGYRLIIYGDGKERENIDNYIELKQLEGVVILHPAVEDIHNKIKDAMMFVSSSDYEGLSNSMIEAMAIGLPTICTDCPCGGARAVIRDRDNGILVPVRNKEKMVQAMAEIADFGCIRQTISFNGCTIREKLAISRIVEIWEKIIMGEFREEV